MSDLSSLTPPPQATAVLVLDDGSVLWGLGFGANTNSNDGKVGEVCFNTGLSGYQETLTDPSYAGQIITFTFPHIGNTGTNEEDLETVNPAALGLIVREKPTTPSNWRNQKPLGEWLKSYNLVGIHGIDTRALTRLIRDKGAPKGILCFPENGEFDLPALLEKVQSWPGLKGMDLAKEVSCTQSYNWKQKSWDLKEGYKDQQDTPYKVVALDFGAKKNILRCLADVGFDVTVMPAQSTAEEILAHKPDGVFLSNGPGDPAATGEYATPMIKALMEKDIPIFGICLGHQLLAQALGGQTRKMHLGHRGANHPVKDMTTGKVEITSQNHGFEVVADSLPEGIEPTHISLFDGTNEGLQVVGKPVFSVQYHPEASPGPQDSFYLFERFRDNIKKRKTA